MPESTNDPFQTPCARDSQFGEQLVTLEPGMLLNNKYELIEQIGRGGMGVVWKARDRVAGRLVALKLVPRDLQRFEAEMQRVRDMFGKVHALNHQSICPLYGLEDGGASFGHYLVMKYLEGETLSSFVRRFDPKRKGLAFNKVTALLARVAHALDYAHKHEVIHRDIKPSNIFLVKTARGYEVQVIDFGLASEIRNSLTRVSQIRFDNSGTRPYMAPEQWRGRRQTAATDQYALAVVAYELLSGHLPFEGNDLEMLRLAVMQDTPEPIHTIPPNANAAIQKALSKDAADRFESCSAFVKAMESPFVDLTSIEDSQSELSGRFEQREWFERPKRSGLSRLLMSRPPLWASICVALGLALLLATAVLGVSGLMKRHSPVAAGSVTQTSQDEPIGVTPVADDEPEPVEPEPIEPEQPNEPIDETPLLDDEITLTNEEIDTLGELDEPEQPESPPYESSFSDIVDAAKKGTVDDVKYFIDKGADVNAIPKGTSCSPLYATVIYNPNIDILKLLIENGADVRAESGNSLLHYAISNVEVLQYLVSQGADVNAKNNIEDSTPLHVAANWSNVEAMKFLIENGADVNAKNVRDETPLHEANYAEVVKCLIENGADVNAKDKGGGTPLHYAYNAEVVKLLIEKGADVNAKDKEGYTPLDNARTYEKKTIIRNAGGKPSGLPYRSLWRDIFDAAEHGTVEDVKYFVETKKVSLRTKNINGYHSPKPTGETHTVNIGCQYDELRHSWLPIHIAARFNTNPEVLKYMIQRGADVNARDLARRTPLHYAACTNPNVEILKCLIEGGANINAKDSLVDGFDLTPLHYAAGFNSNPEVVKYLIEKGADVNPKNKFDVTPLHYAAQFNPDINVLKLLIEKGLSVNAKNTFGATLLHHATYNSNVGVLKFFVAKGLDVNAKTNDGSTLLHTAARHNFNIDILKFLIDKGLDVNAKNNNGQTPLHSLVGRFLNMFPRDAYFGGREEEIANYQKHLNDFVKCLIDNGADVNAKDNDGKTPFDLAHPEGKFILRDHGGKYGHEL